ncbi:16S rRNA (guanine(1207)-N(2))-methyltransferase RsmC [Pectobacteriaceae bacterium C52]|uniref:Ribosomal RNA small subunit methyltransferase C n=1 Tax=Serratia sp. (strain ATCC 39006) TaxID=104623 RepID=A0A2I5TCB8_SERS3|nr:16S rRNA (guanine(1207)-N(2))-methyltransferase RsmC [Serratia sp. ATCC 39006]AUH02209.1 16S rRNA (guanine(1207)-N(2))-methyltransferase RsmC [Serratia sp. ATCC 39006]AUH06530.1 16S rRNA (guanine(1207)-N(2))-methyltransferase RsmC [Serratia sp. ATCC 39006]WJV63180.1 16S rRNA (guanine(1207)-N(2))-methyltransferase RsmC [Pectobacteriaceae bacterium C52]
MSAFTPASEVILRHSDEFTSRRVLFAGDLQDSLPAQFDAVEVRVHTTQYHHWQQLHPMLGELVHFSLLADARVVEGCDTLIYYWPKSKSEAQFQLANLLSLLPVGCEIFVVGENRSGVRSAENILEGIASLNKIDSARRCGLYHGRLDANTSFALDDWWLDYDVDGVPVRTLPGVFSRDGLDSGSQLLLSTLEAHQKGKVLDIASGAGVLAAVFAKRSPKIRLTLSDVSAAALESSKATLTLNQLEGNVVASNVYSDIVGRFDMIISNPPFHEGMKTSLHAAETLIRGAALHLNIGGELRIVANAFLPYPALLSDTFGNHEVIAQNGRFKVYRSVLSRAAKARR